MKLNRLIFWCIALIIGLNGGKIICLHDTNTISFGQETIDNKKMDVIRVIERGKLRYIFEFNQILWIRFVPDNSVM